MSICFLKIVSFMKECEKYGKTRQATDDNTAHAHCMLDEQDYRHTPGIRELFQNQPPIGW